MTVNDCTYNRSRSKRKVQVDGVLPGSYLSSFRTCDFSKNASFFADVLLKDFVPFFAKR